MQAVGEMRIEIDGLSGLPQPDCPAQPVGEPKQKRQAD